MQLPLQKTACCSRPQHSLAEIGKHRRLVAISGARANSFNNNAKAHWICYQIEQLIGYKRLYGFSGYESRKSITLSCGISSPPLGHSERIEHASICHAPLFIV